ncbi:hypothetical protein OROHE_002755 [Orobanche hederae]
MHMRLISSKLSKRHLERRMKVQLHDRGGGSRSAFGWMAGSGGATAASDAKCRDEANSCVRFRWPEDRSGGAAAAPDAKRRDEASSCVRLRWPEDRGATARGWRRSRRRGHSSSGRSDF